MAAQKMQEQVRNSYVWPQMFQTIKNQVSQCPTCVIHSKKGYKSSYGEMPYPTYPFQHIGVDLTGPYRESPSGMKYALSVVDHMSGYAIAVPLPNKTSEAVESALAKEIFCKFGAP
jgi:hypothetical protein